MRTFDEQKCIWCFAKIYLVFFYIVKKQSVDFTMSNLTNVFLRPFFFGKCLASHFSKVFLMQKCICNILLVQKYIFAKQNVMQSKENFVFIHFAKQNVSKNLENVRTCSFLFCFAKSIKKKNAKISFCKYCARILLTFLFYKS